MTRPTLLLLLLLGAAPLIGQDVAKQTVRGRIADAGTAIFLPSVRVVITSGTDSLGETQSDSTGRFQLDVRSTDTAVAHFSRIGFKRDSMVLAVGSELPHRIAMVPLAGMTLAAVSVRGFVSSFERRKKSSSGTFISAEDIEKRRVSHTADLLRRIPGATLSDSMGVIRLVSQRRLRRIPPGPRVLVPDTTPPPQSEGRECVLKVGMDGRLMNEGFSVNDIPPDGIFGIEVYIGVANVPVEFSSVQGDGSCGLVMIWTKVGRERR